MWFGSANSVKQIQHLANIWFVLFADNVSQFLIGALSFLTFAIGSELTHFRLQLTFTLVLTAVTFKFVVNQNLPNIPYLTYLVSMSALFTSVTFNFIATLWISIEHSFTCKIFKSNFETILVPRFLHEIKDWNFYLIQNLTYCSLSWPTF